MSPFAADPMPPVPYLSVDHDATPYSRSQDNTEHDTRLGSLLSGDAQAVNPADLQVDVGVDGGVVGGLVDLSFDLGVVGPEGAFAAAPDAGS